jgi:hypothetical protein
MLTNRELLHSLDLYLKNHPEELDKEAKVERSNLIGDKEPTMSVVMFGNKTGTIYYVNSISKDPSSDS